MYKANQTAKLLAEIAPGPIAALEFTNLQRVADVTCEDPEITYVAFVHSNGKIIVSSGVEKDDENLIDMKISFEGIDMGRVVLHFNQQRVNRIIASEKREALKKVQLLDSQQDRYFKKAVAKLGIGLTVFLVIVLMLLFFQIRKITRPIISIARLINIISKGDLTPMVVIRRNDEIGVMASSVRQMIRSFSALISSGIHASSRLSFLADEQQDAIKNAVQSVFKLSDMTRQNADSAHTASSLVTESKKEMDHAADSMARLTTSIEDISNASNETFDIVKTIDEIAFQTNLLALNASVEAARAGESGSGFAVVAGEVRNLALRAADAARNTTVLIEKTVTEIKNGFAIVNEANNSFEKVVRFSDKLNELITRIASASADQADGFLMISEAVSRAEKVIQKNADTANELSASLSVFKIEEYKGVDQIY